MNECVVWKKLFCGVQLWQIDLELGLNRSLTSCQAIYSFAGTVVLYCNFDRWVELMMIWGLTSAFSVPSTEDYDLPTSNFQQWYIGAVFQPNVGRSNGPWQAKTLCIIPWSSLTNTKIVIFKDFARPSIEIQVLFKAIFKFKDFQGQWPKFKDFSRLCEPCLWKVDEGWTNMILRTS